MEILKHIEGGSPKFRKIQNIYDLWMTKNGSMKKWPVKDRFAVSLEYIVYCIRQGKAVEAEQAAICLMQERDFDKDPISNMVVGLSYCLLWYSVVTPEKVRVGESPLQSENYFKGQDIHDSINDRITEISAYNCKEEDCTFCNQEDKDPHGFASWLMPFKLQYTDKNLEKTLLRYRDTLNGHYQNAIKYLRIALYSSPPLYEALLPLVQMLLLGYHIEEALDELEMFGHSSQNVLALRAKASLLEHVDGENYSKHCSCFEDIIRKDPTCSHSVAKLISFHHKGEHIYNSHQLLEMIALHLEAHKPQADVWKEFASCFLKVCICEDQLYMVHEIFTNGNLGKTWNLRCRWWLNRHFNHDILSSEIEAGDGLLLAYKASTAYHMYGQQSEYVLKACSYLEEHHKNLFPILQKHMQNFVGFYSKIRKS